VERSDTSLAATKLRPPIPPTRLVRRSRLDGIVDAAVEARDVVFVLVSAPAGSGKSTLLASWAVNTPTETAWLQLEESDADPARFWVSVVAALGQIDPSAKARLDPLVRGAMGSGATVVPAIVNELSSRDHGLALVLDDYHLVDDPEVHRGMEQLL
jgi:LuxR family maltose regulon positive regulatory protein